MKSTKTILAVAIVIAGIASVGCGSDVAGSVSLADARDECNLYQNLSIGEPLSEGEFNVLFITAESLRDDGTSKSTFITAAFTSCRDNEPIEAAREQCVVCFTTVAAVVWP